MSWYEAVWLPKQVTIRTAGEVCESTTELLESPLFKQVVQKFIVRLRRRDSSLLAVLDLLPGHSEDVLVDVLKDLGVKPLSEVVAQRPEVAPLLEVKEMLHQFVEELYNYWRSLDRFTVCHSERGSTKELDVRPYRTFNDTIEQLNHLVRAAYRDICENITGDHPRIYRQVAAGAQVGLIAVPKSWPVPREYDLEEVPFIRQMLIDPPLIIDPPMNKRTGSFQKVNDNPLAGVPFNEGEWYCYPAQVGPMVIFVYFHQCFMGLGCALANLFELASDEQIQKGPDAIYAYGVDPQYLNRFGDLPTVFHEDEANDLLIAACPGESRFGYFGYLKKMVLTLHNIIVMKKLRRMPFHGAMTRIVMKNGKSANVVIIGDTAAGKSESLEALRVLGEDYIRELTVIADDMGSFAVEDGKVKGYGTEIGAFVRLDDLQPGYAFDQVDRAVIMSPHKTNARAVMPVTTIDEVLRGYEVNYLFYANNYEKVDGEHPVIQRFPDPETALTVFRDGKAMSKGTTTSSGLVQTYFANIFGPAQYQQLHEELARELFAAAFEAGVYVGQLRTRLGIPGYEQEGPETVAKALFKLISEE
ncbi:MAG: phosphoenolpyruvate carboxykinase [Limnochordia bacterium]